jgi:uncharacterized membrane protein
MRTAVVRSVNEMRIRAMLLSDGDTPSEQGSEDSRRRFRVVISRASLSFVMVVATAATLTASATALFAPRAWMIGLLSLAIAASALAILADRYVAAQCPQQAQRDTILPHLFAVLRIFLIIVAVIAAGIFILFAVGLIVGNIGVGG